MKKLITIIAVSLLTINAQAQYGGVIRAVNNSNVIGEIQRVGASMKVNDTALITIQTAMKLKTDSIYTRLGSGVGVSSIPSATQDVLENILAAAGSIDVQMLSLQPLKLKTDSIYKRMYQDSVNLAKLGTGVTITGSVNSTISGVTKKTLGTQVVLADTALVVNAVMHGLTTGSGGGYVDVKVNPSGALTVDATQAGTWAISLPTNAATESTSSAIYAEISDQSTNYLAPSKLKLDSIYTRLGTGVNVNSHPVTFTRLKASTDTLIANLDATDSTNLAGINSKLGGTLTVGSHAVTNAGTFAVQVDSATQRTTIKVSNFPATQPVSFTRLKASTDTVAITGSITATSTAGATAIYDSTWTAVQMDTAGLGAMANSATVGWQSDSVGLRQWKCTDVKIGVKISMANTAPANDKAVYVYVYPIWYDNSTWYFTSGGTTTFPSGANSTYTIASPNNLRLLGVLSYTTTNMVLQDQFILSNAFGSTMPDAFGLVIVDFSGAALHTTNHRIYYSLINKVQR